MIKKLIKLKRKITGEDTLDFEHRCAFKHQLNYKGVKNGCGEIVEVNMQSGKIGLYKLTAKDVNVMNSTGQMHWKFEFVKYK